MPISPYDPQLIQARGKRFDHDENLVASVVEKIEQCILQSPSEKAYSFHRIQLGTDRIAIANRVAEVFRSVGWFAEVAVTGECKQGEFELIKLTVPTP